MDRAAYNECMRPYISGSRPKDERKRAFCIGAKICSGKADSEEHAAELCARTIPKWAKKALPKGEKPLPCADRISRVHQTIDAISLAVKSGDVEEILPASAQMLDDISQCGSPAVIELANLAAADIKDISKRFYMKGEGAEIQKQLGVIKELL